MGGDEVETARVEINISSSFHFFVIKEGDAKGVRTHPAIPFPPASSHTLPTTKYRSKAA